MQNNQRLDQQQIIARIKEAILTIRRLPAVKAQGYFNAWPDIVYTEIEIIRMDKKTKTWRATPDAITRMEEVLKWILLIEEVDDKKLIWMRAQGIPWEEITKIFGFSRVTANRKWKNAINKITYNYL